MAFARFGSGEPRSSSRQERASRRGRREGAPPGIVGGIAVCGLAPGLRPPAGAGLRLRDLARLGGARGQAALDRRHSRGPAPCPAPVHRLAAASIRRVVARSRRGRGARRGCRVGRPRGSAGCCGREPGSWQPPRIRPRAPPGRSAPPGRPPARARASAARARVSAAARAAFAPWRLDQVEQPPRCLGEDESVLGILDRYSPPSVIGRGRDDVTALPRTLIPFGRFALGIGDRAAVRIPEQEVAPAAWGDVGVGGRHVAAGLGEIAPGAEPVRVARLLHDVGVQREHAGLAAHPEPDHGLGPRLPELPDLILVPRRLVEPPVRGIGLPASSLSRGTKGRLLSGPSRSGCTGRRRSPASQ